MKPEQYLATLVEVKTTTLPIGALFVANRLIYEVVDAGTNLYHKARQWRKDESTEVALASDSSLAQRLPVVAMGRVLPPYRSRDELTENRQPLYYVFGTEQNALEAASLDVALCGVGSGLYVRRNERQPAFEATNGALIFRHYYFMRTNQHLKTNVPDIKYGLPRPLLAHVDGPLYWRLLPSWDESPYDWEKTIAMRPIILDSEDTLPYQPPADL